MSISNFSGADHHQWKAIRRHLMGLSETDPNWQKRHLVNNSPFFSQVKAMKTKPGFLGGGNSRRPGNLRDI
jgi:hypothetical protein